MSKEKAPDTTGDSTADAIAVVAMLAIIMTTVVYWLSGL